MQTKRRDDDQRPASGGAPVSCAIFTPTAPRKPSRRMVLLCVLIPLATLAVLAALFVVSEIMERRLYPGLGMGWRHALVTLRAAIATGVASAAVYLVMRRQHARLSRTAEELTQMLESYRTEDAAPRRFENPHVVASPKAPHGADALRDEDGSAEDRCWQLQALKHSRRVDGRIAPSVQQCRSCDIYRRSCPDRLTELGESFNTMLFLLENKARQVSRMRAQMVEKEKMVAIGQMASGVAHEVGNPLSSISAIVQMLKRGKTSQPPRHQLDLIQTHIRRISTIVRQLVSLARPVDAHWEHVDVGQTLEEAVRLISFDRRAKNVDVAFTPPNIRSRTLALRGELQQVLINLLLNALDAMPDGGTLRVDAKATRRAIDIRIEDTGCGIAEETGRRVFEPFFTTKEVGHGTGLGLSVSYGIIQKHGGTIEFRPAEGRGTVFTVHLPILDHPPE